MHDSRPIWLLAARLPRAFQGKALHRWALEAMHAGNLAAADRLFEAAALRYRADLAVEALARLRVHQVMARVRSVGSPERQVERVIEVERLLSRLDRIESLTPPFDLVDAHTLLAGWLGEAGVSDRPEEVAGALRAA